VFESVFDVQGSDSSLFFLNLIYQFCFEQDFIRLPNKLSRAGSCSPYLSGSIQPDFLGHRVTSCESR
jgi:hypothetical protein